MEEFEEVKQTLSKYLVDIKDYKIDKVIGKGGYGQVSLAFKGGKQYALKELFFKELEGRDLQLFCREVQILGKCDSPFLLRLNGFTLSYPYVIITDYVPKGSLFEALRHRQNSPNLTSTNKTLIALGIAQGMMSLHQMNIIHRDLKSLNILLDERALPHICDFGIAREKASENEPITHQIGTPHWMAPETFSGENYSNKVDVYSYAVLLWEMLTESTPFRGKNPIQIMTIVYQRNERLRIPSNTPEPLKNLIKRCWDRNPDVRPTFAEIYSLFAQKKVMFPDTDTRSVDNLVQMIEGSRKYKKSMNPSETKHLREPSLSSQSELDLIQNLANEIASFDSSNSASFLDVLNSSIENIRPKQASGFFEQLSNFLSNNSNEGDDEERIPKNVIFEVYSQIAKLLNRDDQYLTSFLQSPLFQFLKTNDPDYFVPIYHIYSIIAQNSCSFIELQQYKVFFETNVSHAKEFGHLLTTFSQFYNSNNIAKEITLYSLEKYQIFFNNGGGKELLNSLRYLFNNVNNFEDVFSDQCASIFLAAFDTDDIIIIRLTYDIICTHYNISFYPSEEALIRHLDFSVIIPSVLELLRKESANHLSKEILRKIVSIANDSKAALEFLFFYIKKVDNIDTFLSISNEWMTKLRPIDSVYILSIIIHQQKFYNIGETIVKQDALPLLLFKVIHDQFSFLATVCFILRKLPLSSEFLSKLNDLNFFDLFVDKCLKANQNQIYAGMIDLLQRNEYSIDILTRLSNNIKIDQY